MVHNLLELLEKHMSTNPYSLDLREKVIKFLHTGGTQREAARVFNLSKTTVNRWHIRFKSEGHFRARQRLGAKPSLEINNFIKYVEANPELTLEDIGKTFGMSSGGAHYWLRRAGFSYKKKPSPIWRRAKKSEPSI